MHNVAPACAAETVARRRNFVLGGSTLQALPMSTGQDTEESIKAMKETKCELQEPLPAAEAGAQGVPEAGADAGAEEEGASDEDDAALNATLDQSSAVSRADRNVFKLPVLHLTHSLHCCVHQRQNNSPLLLLQDGGVVHQLQGLFESSALQLDRSVCVCGRHFVM